MVDIGAWMFDVENALRPMNGLSRDQCLTRLRLSLAE